MEKLDISTYKRIIRGGKSLDLRIKIEVKRTIGVILLKNKMIVMIVLCVRVVFYVCRDRPSVTIDLRLCFRWVLFGIFYVLTCRWCRCEFVCPYVYSLLIIGFFM